MELKNLFSPVTVGRMELPNRAVMPAMGTSYADRKGQATDRLIEYLGRRAGGGVGLIVTEVSAVDPRGKGFPNELGAWSNDFIPGLQRLTDAVHQAGAKIAMQLHHAGRETFKAVIGADPEAPSPIPSAILNQPCQQMSIERIREIVEAFAKAAARARAAGFDAVEIHAAHGYLVNQFLSPFSNQRQDTYGGSDENRARFAIEILQAVRQTTGPDFAVLIRVSAEEMIHGGYDLSFMKWLAPRLVSAGADAIHVSVGVYSTPGGLSVASFDTEPGFNLGRARAIKEAVQVPVIGVGRIYDPRLAEEALARGDADLISFGRQHLTDPDFLNKARRGDYDDIRWCLGCNQGCIDRLSYEMKSATCAINPECGKEYKLTKTKAEPPKRVWVIGAGPAGLSAALAAVERGHQVEIFEREPDPGGQLRSASRPPHKKPFYDFVEWAMRQLEKSHVSINLGCEVTAETIMQNKPDAVILAAGARPVVPKIPGIDGPLVFDARAVLMGQVELKSPAVILGAGYVGMETADYLVEKRVSVTILEMKNLPPVGKHTAHGYWLHRRIKKGGGQVILGATIIRLERESVIYHLGDEEHRLEPAAMIITALGAKPEDDLSQVLQELGIPFQIIGDVKKPRRLLEAVHEGAQAGQEI